MQAFELVEESGRRRAEEGGDEVPQLDKGMVERRDRCVWIGVFFFRGWLSEE
jgi:hypothetical protein